MLYKQNKGSPINIKENLGNLLGNITTKIGLRIRG